MSETHEPQEETPGADTPAVRARRLLHTAATASLATASAGGVGDLGAGAPYASLVLPAPDWTGAPLLLLSDLAEHTRNAAADDRVCLLFDATAGLAEPLAGARVAVMGRLRPHDTPAARERYLRYHPGARRYAELADFRLSRLEVAAAHLVAGFGRIAWIAPGDLLSDTAGAEALLEAEPGLVEHMNDEHADAVAEIAEHLLDAPAGAKPGDWRLLGVDPDGVDLAAADGAARRRLTFQRRVDGPEACRGELVRATKRARRIAAGARG